MIVSLGDPDTEALYHGGRGRRGRRFPPNVVATALRKLDFLEAAQGACVNLVPVGVSSVRGAHLPTTPGARE